MKKSRRRHAMKMRDQFDGDYRPILQGFTAGPSWAGHARRFPRFLSGVIALAVLLQCHFGGAGGEPLAAEVPRGGDRPNVILVLTDDQGYGDLACHGNPAIQTPNLDRLYGESTRLTDFHVDPTCAPTRAALMTGRYSCRTGVWHTIMGRSILRRDERTLAELFRQAGYRTAIFGKWHLGDNYPYLPYHRGFEECLIHHGGGIGQGPDYWGNTYFSPMLDHNGRWEKYEGYCTDIFFREARRFISEHRNEAFFLYLATNAPHAPLQVPDRYAEPYRQAGLSDQLAKFYGMITNIDENLGTLLADLQEQGLASRTIVIFMTDNGTAGNGYNVGMRGRKGSMYEGGQRVPCFIRWPGYLPAGRDFHGLTAHIDLAPTLLEFCGIPTPPGVEFDGISLAPYLLHSPAAVLARGLPDRTLFVQVNRIDHPVPWRLSAVLTTQHRLVNGEELYDIQADPGQTRNLAAEKPEVVKELRRHYEDWYADVSQRFDEYCEIMLGADEANPVTLCSHDWHGEIVPWDQSQMEKGMLGNGFWAVEIATAGRYRFALRDRPPYVEHELPLGTARLVLERQLLAEKGPDTVLPRQRDQAQPIVDQAQPIDRGQQEVTFEVQLPPGKTRLQTFLTLPDGKTRGFYFVVVTRLD